MTSLVSLVAAMDRNRLIGARGAMPWHLPADLAWFRRVTMGKPMVMGRVTHESIGRALPGRRNIVMSRSSAAPGEVEWVTSLDAALALAGDVPEIMVIGGGAVYREAMPLARRLYLTHIDATFEGDAWFPAYESDEWRLKMREEHVAGEGAPWRYRFEVLER